MVVSTDISQVDGHCGPLTFPRYQAIRRQENKNCCGHSWSTETHLGISTDMCEPLSPLVYQNTLSKSSLLPYKWEECGVGTQRCTKSQQKLNKIRWKEDNFQLLSFPSFSGTSGLYCFFFASTSLSLNASERSFKETRRHHRTSQYLLVSTVRVVDKDGHWANVLLWTSQANYSSPPLHLLLTFLSEPPT